VKNFWTDIEAFADKKEVLLQTFKRGALRKCPKEYSLVVEGGSTPLFQQAPEALAKRSGSSVYRLGDMYAVKIITDYWYPVVDAMITERRIMRSMMDQPGGPAQYGIANMYELSPDLSEVCRMRMLVTDLLPGTSLEERVLHGQPTLDRQSILKIAAGALEALEKFHKSGFAHGDIHSGNIMIHESSPGDFSVRLIDLGLANPFVDEFGSHIPQVYATTLELRDDPDVITFMSPWHIQSNLGMKYRSSRRDDVFRLAEMMLWVSSKRFRDHLKEVSRTAEVFARRNGLIRFKRYAGEPLPYREIDPPIRRFYRHVLELKFDEEPDYARWIAELHLAGQVGHARRDSFFSLRSISPAEVKYPCVRNFSRDIRAMAAGKIALIRAYMKDKNALALCPMEYSLAVEGDGPPLQQASTPLAEGSGSALFQLGDRYLIKLITSIPEEAVNGFIIERRIMRSMMAQPGGPAQYGIANLYELKSEPPVSEICQLRMLVTDLLPGTSIYKLVESASAPLEKRTIFKIAAGALKALQMFHYSGFAHGDVHWGNFMIHESSPGHFSVRLIDLGMANPFTDEYGAHIPEPVAVSEETGGDDDSGLNIGFLSPWHIESNLGSKYESSRRDDLFRLAEMLFQLSSAAYSNDLSNLGLLEILEGEYSVVVSDFKRRDLKLRPYPEIAPTIELFYRYTLEMRFDEEPNYAKWIEKFKNRALQINLNQS
jgi:serine/threonine protein kinase